MGVHLRYCWWWLPPSFDMIRWAMSIPDNVLTRQWEVLPPEFGFNPPSC